MKKEQYDTVVPVYPGYYRVTENGISKVVKAEDGLHAIIVFRETLDK